MQKEKQHEDLVKLLKEDECKLINIKRDLNTKALKEKSELRDTLGHLLSKSLPKLEQDPKKFDFAKFKRD